MIIAAVPDYDISNKLALETGIKPYTLHVTLAFLGVSTDLDEETILAYTKCIRSVIPQKGIPYTITSVGRFSNVKKVTDAEGKLLDAHYPTDVLYLEVESEELNQFRENLVNALDDKGLFYSKIHPVFKAHMSLIYVPKGMDVSLPYDLPIESSFKEIALWGDPTPRFSYVLEGANPVVLPGNNFGSAI